MPHSPAFAKHLLGNVSHRPAFFYAYLGMWLHTITSTLFFLPYIPLPFVDSCAVLFLASMCFGLVLYALIAHQHDLLVNLAAYILSLYFALIPENRDFVYLLCAALISLGSSYRVIAYEYRLYTEKKARPNGTTLPYSVIGVVVCCLVFLFCYGISTVLY